MKIASVFLAAFLAAALLLAAQSLWVKPDALPVQAKSRLDRITESGALRCGYMIWPPAVMKDPNTGQMSGLFVELMEEIGKQMGFRIDWVAEISPPHMFEDMAAGRYDLVCSPILPTPARGKMGLFSDPVFFNRLNLYARSDDARFDHDYAQANVRDVRFAATEGNIMSVVTAKKFPNATLIGLPETTAPSDTFLQVTTRKADLVISEPLTFALFDKAHPGALRRVKGRPLEMTGAVMVMPAKAFDLKFALDAALSYLHGSGYIDSLLKKYEPEGTPLLRVLPRHESPAGEP